MTLISIIGSKIGQCLEDLIVNVQLYTSWFMGWPTWDWWQHCKWDSAIVWDGPLVLGVAIGVKSKCSGVHLGSDDENNWSLNGCCKGDKDEDIMQQHSISEQQVGHKWMYCMLRWMCPAMGASDSGGCNTRATDVMVTACTSPSPAVCAWQLFLAIVGYVYFIDSHPRPGSSDSSGQWQSMLCTTTGQNLKHCSNSYDHLGYWYNHYFNRS